MSTIKEALQKELDGYEDHRRQMSISDALFEGLLEKKRRRDQKIRICLQGCIWLLMVAFLCFVFLFPNVLILPNARLCLNIFMLVVLLVFMDMCHRILGFITSRSTGL